MDHDSLGDKHRHACNKVEDEVAAQVVAHDLLEGLVILTVVTGRVWIYVFKGRKEVEYHVDEHDPVYDIFKREEVLVGVHIEGDNRRTEQDVDHVDIVHNKVPDELVVVLWHPDEPV